MFDCRQESYDDTQYSGSAFELDPKMPMESMESVHAMPVTLCAGCVETNSVRTR
jgi:hypothetical protein